MNTVYHFSEILDRFDEETAFSLLPKNFIPTTYTVEEEDYLVKYFNIKTDTEFDIVFSFKLAKHKNPFVSFQYYFTMGLLLTKNKHSMQHYSHIYLPNYEKELQPIFDYLIQTFKNVQEEFQTQASFEFIDDITYTIEEVHSLSSSEKQKSLFVIQEYETKHSKWIGKKVDAIFEEQEKQKENQQQQIQKEIGNTLPTKQIADIKKAIDKALDDRDEEQFLRLQQQLKGLQQDN